LIESVAESAANVSHSLKVMAHTCYTVARVFDRAILIDYPKSADTGTVWSKRRRKLARRKYNASYKKWQKSEHSKVVKWRVAFDKWAIVFDETK